MSNMAIAVIAVGVGIPFSLMIMCIALEDTETFRALDERIARLIRGGRE